MKRILSVILAFVITICWVPCLAAETAFSDVPADAWYAPYVEVCVEEGLMKGTSDTTFSPERELTLAETLVLTARLYSQIEDVEIPAAPLNEVNRVVEFFDENETVLADFSDVEFFGPLTDFSGLEARGRMNSNLSPDHYLAYRFPAERLSSWKVGNSSPMGNIARDWPFFMDPDEPSPRCVSDFGSFEADDPVVVSTILNIANLKFADRLMSDPSPYTWYLDEVLFLSDLQYSDQRFSWMYKLGRRLYYEPGTAANTLATRGDFGTMLGQLVPISPIVTQRAPEGIEEIEDQGVRMLIFTGVMEGTGAGYALDRTLTRAEAAAMMARVLRPELRKNQAPEVPVRSPEELTQVAVQHRSFGMVEVQYTLDLEKNSLEVLSPATFGREEEKREVSPLDPAAVTAFRASPAVESLLGWGEIYYNMNILDGHQWSVTLTFSDGTSRDISGSNAYPEGWDLVYDALIELTGVNILSARSDWLEH